MVISQGCSNYYYCFLTIWFANVLYYTMVLIILISRTEIAYIHAYIQHQACDDVALQVY